jgi:hypothetical protein
MIASGHTAAGTTIGLIVLSQTQDPLKGVVFGCLFGLIFHYLADFIPHGHYLTHKQFGQPNLTLIIDLLGTFFIFYSLTLLKFGLGVTSLTILAAIGGSQLPDVIEGLLYFKKIPKVGLIRWENNLHQKFFHWHGYHENALPWSWKDIWQILFVLAAFLILLIY